MSYQTGECAVCGQEKVLRDNGAVNEHKDPNPANRTRLNVALGWTPPCPGTGEEPKPRTVQTHG